MEREDQSSNQDPDNERRSRSERSWRRELFFDQEPDESPGREGQVSLMVERDQLSLILDGFLSSSEDLKIWRYPSDSQVERS